MASIDELPVVDLAKFLGGENDPEGCALVAECLRERGVLVIRDPRCSSDDSNNFLDMMERYFELPTEEKKLDSRPDLMYQVGVTPEFTEVPRAKVDPKFQAEIAAQPEEHKAQLPTGPDPKWRYMWRIGERPKDSKFQELNAAPVVPKAIPEWTSTMDSWGGKLVSALEVVCEMAALGYGLERDAFRSRMNLGPHLLAPTGSDLSKYNSLNTIFAGYHYDLNFLTIHGKSRFPGLFVWLRDGRRVPVAVPDGCLLVQAGKQLEWLTGGHVRAGMHEVVVTPATLEKAEANKAAGKSHWRVSSTVFGHIASDVKLEPLGSFAESQEAKENYPPVLTGDFVKQELEAIALGGGGKIAL